MSKSQHKLSELIAKLQQVEKDNGNLNVVYWDGEFAYKFDNFSDALWINKGSLYLGGMIVNASQCYDLPSEDLVVEERVPME